MAGSSGGLKEALDLNALTEKHTEDLKSRWKNLFLCLILEGRNQTFETLRKNVNLKSCLHSKQAGWQDAG